MWTMVESILKNRAVVHSLLIKHSREDLIIRAKEMRFLQKLLQFLEPFKKQTVILQAEKWPTLSLAWPAFLVLLNKCEHEEEDDLGSNSDDDLDIDETDGVNDTDYYDVMKKLKTAVAQALKMKFPKENTCILATSLDIRFKGCRDELKTVVFRI